MTNHVERNQACAELCEAPSTISTSDRRTGRPSAYDLAAAMAATIGARPSAPVTEGAVPSRIISTKAAMTPV